MNLEWVNEEFKNLELGDARLDSRFKTVVKSLANSPSETINRSLKEWKDKKAAYRLISNKKFTTDKFLHEHQAQTLKRLQNFKVALAIHDTSFFSFNSKRSIKGLGSIGGKLGDEDTYGFIGHYTLALTPNDLPQGITSFIAWSRGQEQVWEKESGRWLDGIEESQRWCPQGTQMIHIADREADQFEIYHRCACEGWSYIIRSKHDRVIENGDYYLSWYLKKKKENDRFFVFHPKLKKNTEVSLKYGQLKLYDPSVSKKSGRATELRRSVIQNIIEVKTVAEGLSEKDELKWVLFTNLEVNSFADALRILDYYKKRWHIENFFKVLKDGGCRVEGAHLRNFERLEKYICFFSIIAWRLYHIKHLSELTPNEDCRVSLSENEAGVIKLMCKMKSTDHLPLEKAIRYIGKLGGHNGRKGDGVPGMVSLWRGWIKLEGQAELFEDIKSQLQF